MGEPRKASAVTSSTPPETHRASRSTRRNGIMHFSVVPVAPWTSRKARLSFFIFHSPPAYPPHSPTHPLTHSPVHPLTHSPVHPFTHSPIHPFTRSPIHPLTLARRRSHNTSAPVHSPQPKPGQPAYPPRPGRGFRRFFRRSFSGRKLWPDRDGRDEA